MNRYRFYEILQANKNGEDLSQFVPNNPAEAQLLASLKSGAGDSGGTGGSSGGGSSNTLSVSDHPYNNPNLPNLYYFMPLKNKNTLCIDFNKLVDYEIEYGIFGYTEKKLSDTFTSDAEFEPTNCKCSIFILTMSDLNWNNLWYCYFGFSNGNMAFYDSERNEYHIIGSYQAEDTVENVLRSLGEQRFELANILPNSVYEHKNELSIFEIAGPVFTGGAINGGVVTNLNDYPIEHMWFE